ncbi:hypothetical protein ACFX13_000764 [Malus domestica]
MNNTSVGHGHVEVVHDRVYVEELEARPIDEQRVGGESPGQPTRHDGWVDYHCINVEKNRKQTGMHHLDRSRFQNME